MDIKSLKEKDPEFYKYLEQNDRDLLDFDPDEMDVDNAQDDDDDENEDEESDDDDDSKSAVSDSPVAVVLTRELLRSWQKSIIEVRVCSALLSLLPSGI